MFLVKQGLVEEPHLAEVLMEEAAGLDKGHTRTPLGQRLAERGFVSEAIVRKAMQRLTVARMFELAHWRSGVFSYDEPEEMPQFQISIGGNVQDLLLQAQVRIDHGDRPRKRVMVKQGDELCLGCSVADCTPAVKLKYLKKDTCLWRKMSNPPEIAYERRRDVRPEAALGDILAEEARAEASMHTQWGQF